jgi:hypothetical protein
MKPVSIVAIGIDAVDSGRKLPHKIVLSKPKDAKRRRGRGGRERE